MLRFSAPSALSNVNMKMAPRRKSVNGLRPSVNGFPDKENVYLRSLSDYQARVRRRDTIRKSKNTLECDLEQKIELEMKMWEASTRLLAESRQTSQALEAARALLTSNERMSVYIAELQRQKKESKTAKVKNSLVAATPSRGRLSLSDLRFPLVWRDSDHFKNRGDHRVFAIFCLARIGSDIHDTSLVYPIDREHTDISFPDVLLFDNVPAEFELTLEVYSHIVQDDFAILGARQSLHKTIHSSISRMMGKKCAASIREEQNLRKTRGGGYGGGGAGPTFQLVASAKLNLESTNSNIHTHDLILKSAANKQRVPPLFGHFCCRVAVRPECLEWEPFAGHIILNGRKCWARLYNFRLRAWKSRIQAEDESDDAICDIPVEKDTQLRKKERELRVINSYEKTTNKSNECSDTIRFQADENAEVWFSRISSLINEHWRWKHAVIDPQEVRAPCANNARSCYFNEHNRQISLYDETPFLRNDERV